MSRPHVRVSVQSLKATSLEHLHHLLVDANDVGYSGYDADACWW